MDVRVGSRGLSEMGMLRFAGRRMASEWATRSSRVMFVSLSAAGASAADASAATYKLSAALDTLALMFGRIGASQIAATSAETVAMAQCAAHVRKAAETAREAAAMTQQRIE